MTRKNHFSTVRVFRMGLWMASMICVTGCGGSVNPRGTVDVSGTVTVGGQPLSGASVYFMGNDFTGFSLTDSAGRFQLVDGAKPGANKVFISKIEAPGVTENADSGMDLGQLQASQMANPGTVSRKNPGPKETLPPEFSDPQKTTLSYDVPAQGARDANFQL